MISFFVAILGIISLIDIKFAKSDQFFDNYLNQEFTNAIKGIFVMMIFTSHYRYNMIPKDKQRNIPLDIFSQKMVSMFLFYSGIGIMESIKKKGKKYSNRLILKVFIFYMKLLVMIILNLLLLKIFNFREKTNIKYSLKYLLLKFSHFAFHYHGSWYIRTYITLIFYCFIGFLPFNSERNSLSIILTTIFIYIHYRSMIYFKKPIYFYDNLFPFTFGLFYSKYRELFEKMLKRNDKFYYFFLVIAAILLYKNDFFNSNYMPKLITEKIIFSVLIVIITLKVQINNNLLQVINKHSLGILITQGLIFKVCIKFNLFNGNEYIKFIIIFLLTISAAILFDESTDYIGTYINAIDIEKLLNRQTFVSIYHMVKKINKNNLNNIMSQIKNDETIILKVK